MPWLQPAVIVRGRQRAGRRLNPVEQHWYDFGETSDAILDAGCNARNRLPDQPETIL